MGKILNMQDNYDKSCYERAEDELINGTINATSGNSERRQDGEMASRNKFMRLLMSLTMKPPVQRNKFRFRRVLLNSSITSRSLLSSSSAGLSVQAVLVIGKCQFAGDDLLSPRKHLPCHQTRENYHGLLCPPPQTQPDETKKVTRVALKFTAYK